MITMRFGLDSRIVFSTSGKTSLVGQLVVRLVQNFEVEPIGSVTVAGSNLLPQARQPRRVLGGVAEHLVVMVHVDDRCQLARQRLVDRPIDALEEVGVDLVRRLLAGMGRPADRDAHRLEAGLLDLLEVVGLERDAPGPFLGRLQGVAEVDAAAEELVVVEGIFLRLGGKCGQGSYEDRRQYRHPHCLHS
jgi:hypothetical protein